MVGYVRAWRLFFKTGWCCRPRNMVESEIQLYIACKLVEVNDISFYSGDYLDSAFIKVATPVIEKCNLFIHKVSLPASELILFVLDFYEYADKKLKPRDKSKRWQKFGEYLKERKA